MSESYTTIDGKAFELDQLTQAERELLSTLQRKQEQSSESSAFFNYYMPAVGDFYRKLGLAKKDVVETALWKMAQDLNARLMMRLDEAEAPDDYRDDLQHLIVEKFPTRRQFCEATGLSEDMLGHVLAGRKHFAIDTLAEGMRKIGYRIQLSPMIASSR